MAARLIVVRDVTTADRSITPSPPAGSYRLLDPRFGSDIQFISLANTSCIKMEFYPIILDDDNTQYNLSRIVHRGG